MAGSGPGEGGDPARRGRPAGALRDVNPLTRKGAALFSGTTEIRAKPAMG